MVEATEEEASHDLGTAVQLTFAEVVGEDADEVVGVQAHLKTGPSGRTMERKWLNGLNRLGCRMRWMRRWGLLVFRRGCLGRGGW